MPTAVDAIYEDGVFKPERPVGLKDKTKVRLVIEEETDTARTPLGRRLRELRGRLVESGAPLLNWGEISEEVAARRGGYREPR
jgi:predicted DNA-binding antitoxin AbrB/MazE fold protein